MLRCAFLAALGLIATAGSLSAQTKPDESPPAASSPAPESANGQEAMEDAQTGDHWTYEFRDEITGDVKSTITNTVTDVSASEIGTRIASLGNPNSGYQTFDHSWNLINNGAWRYTPNDGTGIKAPLAVGKTWSFKSTDLNSTAGVSWKRSSTSKVLAQESVTTRAGTFDTFKIETTFTGRNVNNPTLKNEVTAVTWYAPAIDHWVKRTFVSRADKHLQISNSIELVDYGRKQ
jgi:hypothetical protein